MDFIHFNQQQKECNMNKLKLMVPCMAIIAASLLSLSGCGDNVDKQAQQKAQANKEAVVEPIVIKFGYENNPGEPFDLGANKWKELVEQKSNGTIKVELYPSSQLGSKADIIDSMILGDKTVTLADGSFYAERGITDFGIVFAPFLFDTWEEAFKLNDSPWFHEQEKLLNKKGIKILAANWKYGDRHTLTTKPIKSIEDFKGVKIRVATNEILSEGTRVLGATPTPMPLGEVYTSLQQGTIDGVENPIPVLYNGKFQEVAKYLLLDAHIRNITNIIIGYKFFSSLTPEQQKLLTDSCVEAGKYQNAIVDKLEKELLEKMKKEGVTVTDPSEEFKQQMREKAKAFYELPQFKDKWSPNLYETVKANCK